MINMGHDIGGFNKKGEEIAYARYSMSNYNSDLLYKAFDSSSFHAGVSGNGADKIFTIEQVKNAKVFLNNLNDDDFKGDIEYEKEKLENFIYNCLETAKKEGCVRIGFY
jgi:hypothetical protein